MIDEIQTKKYDVEKIRKKYPKAGTKWLAEEDELLKKLYGDFRAAGQGDFEVFLAELTKKFERAAGGLKARLAMHFDDVPGWDYEREKSRQEELNKKVDAAFSAAHNEILKREYQKYLEAKRETYLAFLKRLSQALGGVKGGLIRHRLEQLVGSVEKYGRDNVNPYGRWRNSSSPLPQIRRSLGKGGTGEDAQRADEGEKGQFDFSSNPKAQEALRVMGETRDNLFLTGEAGTGKSTLLQYFRKATKKNVAVLAPTGVAAINVEGQTIHSFCGFGPDITLQKVKKLGPGSGKFQLLQKLHTIIIDEISMVRADLLDCVDKFLRVNGPAPHEPFGGIQMVFIGDLYQLPPVEKDFVAGDGLIKLYQSPYFFDSRAFRNAKFRHIQLKQIYRQRDQVFIDVLNAVRNNIVNDNHLVLLNQRVLKQGEKLALHRSEATGAGFAIYLTPHNEQARKVNNFFLDRLKPELKIYEGVVRGSFEDRQPPTDLSLRVKVGAQVMMLNNDYKKRWVNGTMGKIVGIEKGNEDEFYVSNESYSSYDNNDGDVVSRFIGSAHSVIPDSNPGSSDFDSDEDGLTVSDSIIIELGTGETVYVQPHTWEMFQFVLDKRTQKVDSKTTGTFTQYPFKLAWAVTIHKAQGKTFDKVYIDLSTGTFAHGQLYVALSRCRQLSGLYLKRPITQSDIILDSRIVDFLHSLNPEEFYYSTAEE